MRIQNRFNAFILTLGFKGNYSKMSLGTFTTNSPATPTDLLKTLPHPGYSAKLLQTRGKYKPAPRAYHTGTIIGKSLWVYGGCTSTWMQTFGPGFRRIRDH